MGERQPAWVHCLGWALNGALGNLGTTIKWTSNTALLASAGNFAEFFESAKSGKIKTLIVAESNPVYSAPADFALNEIFKSIPTTVTLSYFVDETAVLSTWHIPLSHALESWGDLRSSGGVSSLQQPLIAPLYDSLSTLEFLSLITLGVNKSGYDIVQNTWAEKLGAKGEPGKYPRDFVHRWERWLNNGVCDGPAENVKVPAFDFARISSALISRPPVVTPTKDALEIVYPLGTATV